jgi:hypothetical protein
MRTAIYVVVLGAVVMGCRHGQEDDVTVAVLRHQSAALAKAGRPDAVLCVSLIEHEHTPKAVRVDPSEALLARIRSAGIKGMRASECRAPQGGGRTEEVLVSVGKPRLSGDGRAEAHGRVGERPEAISLLDREGGAWSVRGQRQEFVD